MKEMQLDVKSTFAQHIVPIFVASLKRGATKELIPYVDVLAGWDCESQPDSSGAAIFETTFNTLLVDTFKDELGADLFKSFMEDKGIATNTLYRLVTSDRTSPFFDDVTTEKKETFDDTLMRAFGEAVVLLSEKMGNNPTKWRWGAIHPVEFRHVFGQVNVLRPFFDYGPFPFGGSDQSLDRGGYNKNKPYDVDITASIRYIVDFSNLNRSLIVLSTGECASLTSPYREDMTDMFLKGEYGDWLVDEKDIREVGVGTLKFIPGK